MLTDLYEPYDYSDVSGPGCGRSDHDDDCLCDVILAAEGEPDAPVDLARDGYYGIATKVAGIPRDHAGLARWAAELLGAFEAVQTTKIDVEALEEAANLWRNASLAVDRRAAAMALVRAVPLAVAAAFVAVPVPNLTGALGLRGPAAAYVTADEMLRSAGGTVTFYAVAKATGLPGQAVRRWRLGGAASAQR